MKLKLTEERVVLLRSLLEPVASSDPDPEKRRIARGLVFSLDFEMRREGRQ